MYLIKGVVEIKKRTMKKWIPKNTDYCGKCKWRKYLGIYELNETNCKYTKECLEKHGECTKCTHGIYKCEYLNYIDKTNESLLWDGCKECGVHTDYKIKPYKHCAWRKRFIR